MKKKGANGQPALLAVLLALLAGLSAAAARVQAQDAPPQEAQAHELVLLLQEEPPTRPGLWDSLRIQLLGVAQVERVFVPPATTNERLQQASQLARERNALLSLWADPPLSAPQAEEQTLLYLVGRRPGTALVKLVRVPGGRGPDVDRSLALKAREVLDELRAARTARQAPSHALDAESPLPPEPMPGLMLEAGVFLAPAGELGVTGWGPRVAAGATLPLNRLRLAAFAELAVAVEASASRNAAQVELHELSPALGALALQRFGPLSVGLRLGAGLSATSAAGRTPGNVRAEKHRLVLSGSALGRAELALGAGLQLAIDVGLSWRARRQRFTVNQSPVVEIAPLRPLAAAALVWLPPL